VKWMRRRSNPTPHLPRHLFLPLRHPTLRRRIPVALLLCLFAGWMCAASPATPQKKSKQEVLENQFLIYGTVFTEQGFAMPGAEVKVRRTSERKQRWEAYSDRRGEFAVRVPKGNQYEIAIKAKRYAPLTRTVDARSGDRQGMVFRMEPAAEGKRK
jgi:hypothetical protein